MVDYTDEFRRLYAKNNILWLDILGLKSNPQEKVVSYIRGRQASKYSS